MDQPTLSLEVRTWGRADRGDATVVMLHHRLGSLPPDTVVFPGHAYSGASAPMGTVREHNAYLRVRDLPTWMQMMGAG